MTAGIHKFMQVNDCVQLLCCYAERIQIYTKGQRMTKNLSKLVNIVLYMPRVNSGLTF